MDVSEHTLVPEHRLLDEDEVVERVLEEYDVKRVNLPKILTTDPAVPDDAEPGDVVEIIRHESRTADVAHVYRLVVE